MIMSANVKEKSFFGKLVERIYPRREQKLRLGDISLMKDAFVIDGTSPIKFHFTEITAISIGLVDYSRLPKQYRTYPCVPLKIKISPSDKKVDESFVYLMIDFDGMFSNNELWFHFIKDKLIAGIFQAEIQL